MLDTWLSLILIPIIENKIADKAERDAIVLLFCGHSQQVSNPSLVISVQLVTKQDVIP